MATKCCIYDMIGKSTIDTLVTTLSSLIFIGIVSQGSCYSRYEIGMMEEFIEGLG